MMKTLWQDIRYGLRVLRQAPGFTAVAIITLALGIGANTAIFSVVNAVLLRQLPYPDADELVTTRRNESVLSLEEIKAQSQTLETIGGATVQALDYTGADEPVQVEAALVTHEIFKVFDIGPATGRTISEHEDRVGGERVVLLSHDFWQRGFNGEAGVIGRTIPLSGNNYTVIGVMPKDFQLPHSRPEVWASVRVVNPVAAAFRGVKFLRTYGRLKPGVSIARAQAERVTIDERLARAYPEEDKGRRTTLLPLRESVVGDTRPTLLVLFGAVGFILLIACANFANLLLSRTVSRRQEFAVRAALGAGRLRILRQILTESVLLSALGGAAGLLLALWGVEVLLALAPESLPRLSSVGLDAQVLAFTLAISIITGVLFGLVPALGASSPDTNEMLKEKGRGGTGGVAGSRVRSLLVISELGLAVVLLIGAGLLVKGFYLLRAVEPGFDPKNVLTMRIEMPEARYAEIPRQTQFRERVLEAVNSLPGVEGALVSEVPLSGSSLHHNFVIEGRPAVAPGDEDDLYSRSVGGDYFRTMKIPVLRGRGFTAQDTSGAPFVGIVNESFVRRYFPNADPVGARFRWTRAEGEPQWISIVGVVGDIKHFGLRVPEEPAAYTPYAQSPQAWKRWSSLVVRSNSDPAALARTIKNQIWTVDKQIPVTKVQTMSEVMATSIAQQRFSMSLLGVFAGVALVLAAVGIYGVIAYSVTQRTHEIGIRIALGAQRGDVLRLVVGRGLALTFIGVALGLAGATALTRVMASLLYGVSATDPAIFIGGSLLLAGVALLACYIPARRATRVDPMVALRYE